MKKMICVGYDKDGKPLYQSKEAVDFARRHDAHNPNPVRPQPNVSREYSGREAARFRDQGDAFFQPSDWN